jgi:hypothetical protein
VKNRLDVWPDLPLVIHDSSKISLPEGLDNIIALLRTQPSRVSNPPGRGSHLEEVLAAMEVPSPKLTELWLASYDFAGQVPVGPGLCDSFLGGSAPHLRRLHLFGIPFPSLPKLLLSATHLVELYLFDLPLAKYIHPRRWSLPLPR